MACGLNKMAAETSVEEPQDVTMEESTPSKDQGVQKMFTLKKWNAVAMWSWDVECDTCAICRVQVMGEFRSCNFQSVSEVQQSFVCFFFSQFFAKNLYYFFIEFFVFHVCRCLPPMPV